MSDSPPRTIFKRCDDMLVFVNRWALIVLLAVMSVLVIVNVFARYVFSHSFPWVEEATRYMMIWAAFLGAGPALRVGGHIAIESLGQSLPPPAARALRALIVALIAVILVVLIWLGIDYADFAWYQESPVLSWSLGKVYLALPIGLALTLAHLAAVARAWILSGEFERADGFDPQAL
jgi:TRAP-type C4-dicarboxylate transport system permease small subunit